MKRDKDYMAYKVGYFLGSLKVLVFYGGVIYVAWHFISKFW